MTQEQANHLLTLVTDMQRIQREWFGGDKRPETLAAARRAEASVDRLLRELDSDPRQRRLFG